MLTLHITVSINTVIINHQNDDSKTIQKYTLLRNEVKKKKASLFRTKSKKIPAHLFLLTKSV